MNIALMSHDNKKELMVQFCTAYCGHSVSAYPVRHQHHRPHGRRRHGSERPLLPVLSPTAAASRSAPASPTTSSIWCCSSTIPSNKTTDEDIAYISRLCDQNNIPFASNLATAEMLVLGLARGDLDWRNIVNPKTKPFTA